MQIEDKIIQVAATLWTSLFWSAAFLLIAALMKIKEGGKWEKADVLDRQGLTIWGVGFLCVLTWRIVILIREAIKSNRRMSDRSYIDKLRELGYLRKGCVRRG